MSEMITVKFTPKLAGLKPMPDKDFPAEQPIGEIQRTLARVAPQTKGANVVVYCFVNDSFMPTPDETVGGLTDLFGSKGGPNEKRTLSIQYALQIYQG